MQADLIAASHRRLRQLLEQYLRFCPGPAVLTSNSLPHRHTRLTVSVMSPARMELEDQHRYQHEQDSVPAGQPEHPGAEEDSYSYPRAIAQFLLLIHDFSFESPRARRPD